MPIMFIVRWYPRPERRDRFLGIIERLGAALTSATAQGVEFIRPTFNRDGQFIVVEVWKDAEILDGLRRSALFHDAIRELTDCCTKPLEIEYLNPLDADGTVFARYPRGTASPTLYPDLESMTPVVL